MTWFDINTSGFRAVTEVSVSPKVLEQRVLAVSLADKPLLTGAYELLRLRLLDTLIEWIRLKPPFLEHIAK